MNDEPVMEGKLEFVGYEDRDREQASGNPFFKMGQMLAEKDARIRELEALLGESERALTLTAKTAAQLGANEMELAEAFDALTKLRANHTELAEAFNNLAKLRAGERR